MDDALGKEPHVSRMSVSENHPTWAKRTWSGHSGQACSSLIGQIMCKKTNQKNLHISAGKHPFDTFKVHQVRQLLGLKSQTSEHGSKCNVFASDLRACDVEGFSQRRGSQRWHVSEDLGLFEVELIQLREVLQSLDVAGDLGLVEVELLQLPEILQG